jgi:hypothetical protein
MTRRNRPLNPNPTEPVVDLPPDIVEKELWSLSEFAEKHWKTIAIGLGAVTVVWGGLGIWQIVARSQDDSKAAQSADLFLKAGTLVQAPPAEGEPEAATDVATFPTAKARAEAVLAAAKEAGEIPEAAKVLVGGANAQLGKWQEALAAVEAALPASAGTAMEVSLWEQKATALAGLGKSADAAAAWAKVAELAGTPFGKAHAQVRIGDLAAPAGKGDVAKAKAAYEAAIKASRPGDKDPAPGNLAFILADARTKLAQL